MPKNQFFAKMKNDRGARAIAITVMVLLVLLSAIIITTVIANRRTKDVPVLPDEPTGGEPAGVVDPKPDDVKPTPNDQPKPDDGKQTETAPTHYILPVSGVLTKKHDSEMQVFSDTMRDYRVHLGIDIATVAGASVSAMADGVIAQIWDDRSMGKCIAIKHGGDVYTIYKNLAETLPEQIAVGVSVKAGDVIGNVGETASVEVADEAHLHLEMTEKGLQVDPTKYLDADALATLHEDTNFEDES